MEETMPIDDTTQELSAALLGVPVANWYLTKAMVIGLVDARVLTPEQASQIVINAIYSLKLASEREPNNTSEQFFPVALSFLDGLLQHPGLKRK